MFSIVSLAHSRHAVCYTGNTVSGVVMFVTLHLSFDNDHCGATAPQRAVREQWNEHLPMAVQAGPKPPLGASRG